ncbi:hypothetical protein CHH67_12145 [Paenibacillus campinasensis]|uniref:Uncharacterized protein n=1 Tax=Paenibacillus campinasensis TaxID=66347 RepID=A0A268ETH8_9BACL|nr:hypothetical protein CHH67_12145 [Paenibacillus campinasensis]
MRGLARTGLCTGYGMVIGWLVIGLRDDATDQRAPQIWGTNGADNTLPGIGGVLGKKPTASRKTVVSGRRYHSRGSRENRGGAAGKFSLCLFGVTLFVVLVWVIVFKSFKLLSLNKPFPLNLGVLIFFWVF